jgi:Uma2 family endonuclease
MTSAASARLMTTDELLAMPDDGVERWLVNGELREQPMTKRNRLHSRILARVCQLLCTWLDSQPRPHGEVVAGEAGFRLKRNPDTTCGIDVAYVSPEVIAAQHANARIIEGPPILAIEILSPSEKLENIDEKIDLYRSTGVKLIWVIDIHDETVLVYRPEQKKPRFFDIDQVIEGEPYLPGLRAPVARIFE